MGNVIPEENSLLVASVAKFNNWFGADEEGKRGGVPCAWRWPDVMWVLGAGSKSAHPPPCRPLPPPAGPAPPPRPGIDVQLDTEVVAIDRSAKRVTARNTQSGSEAQLEYDALVLAPGAAAIRPPLPGIDLPGIFKCKEIPDV